MLHLGRLTTYESIVVGFMLALAPLAALYAYHESKEIIQTSCTKDYKFTSASLGCAQYDESSDRLHTLDSKLEEAATLYENEGKVIRLSVWVRDLETKQYAAVDENSNYAPASLMKVPLLISYYRLAEIDPSILDNVLTDDLPTNLNTDEYYLPTTTLSVDKKYTVTDLLHLMIVNSDNNAAAVLYENINKSFFTQTLIDLGLKIPAGDADFNYVSVKNYGTIFRNLYNASYLTRTYSEKALELLASPSPLRGIEDALPADVAVADKFGERTYTQGATEVHQLHDCGIVYLKSRPYSLCIMTEGKNFDQLRDVIRSISKLTYDTLNN